MLFEMIPQIIFFPESGETRIVGKILQLKLSFPLCFVLESSINGLIFVNSYSHVTQGDFCYLDQSGQNQFYAFSRTGKCFLWVLLKGLELVQKSLRQGNFGFLFLICFMGLSFMYYRLHLYLQTVQPSHTCYFKLESN